MVSSQLPLLSNEVAIRVGVSVLVGLLIGLEREWAQKEVGVRTFAIVTLLGTLTSLMAPGLVIAGLCGIFLLVTFLNVHSLLRDRSLELTTSAAMIISLILGALVGQGYFFAAAASSILVTMLLAWKAELARFADALQPEEIRGAVLLGLLSIVIYPLLPNRFVDPYHLINPQQAWVTVVVIAGIGFVNYVLLRLYSTRGLYYAALLGGLVNSTAAVAELSVAFRQQPSRSPTLISRAVAVLLLTNVAMFLRNLVLLGIFAPAALRHALVPMTAMASAALLVTWLSRPREADPAAEPLKLQSPVSLKRVLKFGVLFLALAAGGTLAQRQFGSYGFLVVSILGGLISSASTVASAASLAASGAISPELAATATALTSMSSALVNIPLVYQQTASQRLGQRLALATGVIVLAGLVVLSTEWWTA